jgi:hypothetical protein
MRGILSQIECSPTPNLYYPRSFSQNNALAETLLSIVWTSSKRDLNGRLIKTLLCIHCAGESIIPVLCCFGIVV